MNFVRLTVVWRREQMRTAMCIALVLMRGHDFRYLQDFGTRDFVWLLIGAFLALIVTWAVARQRRRWF